MLGFSNTTLLWRSKARDIIHCHMAISNKLEINHSENFSRIFFLEKNSNRKHRDCIIYNGHRFKFLGIIIDSLLTFEEHREFVCRKLQKFVSILARLRKSCNRKTLILLYWSSALSFCVWNFDLPLAGHNIPRERLKHFSRGFFHPKCFSYS